MINISLHEINAFYNVCSCSPFYAITCYIVKDSKSFIIVSVSNGRSFVSCKFRAIT